MKTLCEAVVSFGARRSQLAFVYADNQCRASGGPSVPRGACDLPRFLRRPTLAVLPQTTNHEPLLDADDPNHRRHPEAAVASLDDGPIAIEVNQHRQRAALPDIEGAIELHFT